MWSDETRMELFGGDVARCWWRGKKNTIPTVKQEVEASSSGLLFCKGDGTIDWYEGKDERKGKFGANTSIHL